VTPLYTGVAQTPRPLPLQQDGDLFDVGAVRAWLDTLHGDSAGLAQICSTGNWTGQAFDDLDAATEYVAQLEWSKPAGIYCRVTTIREALTFGSRGSADDSLALPGLWLTSISPDPGIKGLRSRCRLTRCRRGGSSPSPGCPTRRCGFIPVGGSTPGGSSRGRT
jgi:hypothetical protein